MAVKVVLDTNAVIYLLAGESKALPHSSFEVGVSVISEIELLGWSGVSEAQEAALRRFLRTVPTITISPEIKETAISLKRSHGLKTPDAIIVATAQTLNATLITNDQRLRKIPGLKSEGAAPPSAEPRS